MYDAYDYWEKCERAKELWLESRPICGMCGEHIQDETCIRIAGDRYCHKCIDESEELIDD